MDYEVDLRLEKMKAERSKTVKLWGFSFSEETFKEIMQILNYYYEKSLLTFNNSPPTLWNHYLLSLLYWNHYLLSGLGLRRFFGVTVIFNAKFVLDLGMVRIQRGFRILGCLWDVLIISILKYVFKWFPVGTCVM